MFKKILVPLDGSKLAAKVLPQVLDLAKAGKAKVTLLHVCEAPVGPEMGEAPPSVIKKAAKQEAKWCATFLGKAAKDLKAKGLQVDSACVEGVAAREIIGYAEKKKMDLIALATHGKGEVAWVLGSTAEKVVSHATVPVLLFRVIEFKPPLLKEEFFIP